jgi:hypothetical protein
MKKRRYRCNREHKFIFWTELDAKMALATRVWKDKGEIRYYPCGDHFHLTSQERKGQTSESLTSSSAA